MLINVKMPTIVGISTFMSMINCLYHAYTVIVKNTTSESFKSRKVFIFQHFSFMSS